MVSRIPRLSNQIQFHCSIIKPFIVQMQLTIYEIFLNIKTQTISKARFSRSHFPVVF